MAGAQKRTWASGKHTYIARWRTLEGREHSKGGFRTRKLALETGIAHGGRRAARAWSED
jgi:hypothetical protein